MATLELHRQADGPRYYLDGQPVRAGETLEAQLFDGRWEHVRFECFWDYRDDSLEPSFIRGGEAYRMLPIETPCRWPAQRFLSNPSRYRPV